MLIHDTLYRGSFEVRRDGNGLFFIMSLPFEQYIEGVIAAETGEDWAEEALKAQAVISRTYALYQKTKADGMDYHITSSVLHQAYKGDEADEIIGLAVRETEGEILTYDGDLIQSFYHATCRGRTELPEAVWGEDYPYLKSVPCRGKNAPYGQWQRRFHLEEIEKVMGLSGIKDIHITSHTSTGRAELLTVTAEGLEKGIKAVDLRRLLGYGILPSTHFSVSVEGDEAVFQGGGYGHGVGLSQWGALELAHEGKTYREILEHYYPGTVLQKDSGI
jgi:stage II sporulation protein D